MGRPAGRQKLSQEGGKSMKCNSHDPKIYLICKNRGISGGQSGTERHKMDPLYALFERYPAREEPFRKVAFTDTSICTWLQVPRVACKQWDQRCQCRKSAGLRQQLCDNTYNLSALNLASCEIWWSVFPRKMKSTNQGRPCLEILAERPLRGRWLFCRINASICRQALP